MRLTNCKGSEFPFLKGMTEVTTLAVCVGGEKGLHDMFPPVVQQLSSENGKTFHISGRLEGFKFEVTDELADHLAKTFLVGTFGGASESRGPNTGRGLAPFTLLVHDQGDNQITLGEIAQDAETYNEHLRLAAATYKAGIDKGREARAEAAHLREHDLRVLRNLVKPYSHHPISVQPNCTLSKTISGVPALHIASKMIQLYVQVEAEGGSDANRRRMESILVSIAGRNQTGKLVSTTATLRRTMDTIGSDHELAFSRFTHENKTVRAWWNLAGLLRDWIRQLWSSTARTAQRRLQLRILTFLVHMGICHLTLAILPWRSIKSRSRSKPQTLEEEGLGAAAADHDRDPAIDDIEGKESDEKLHQTEN